MYIEFNSAIFYVATFLALAVFYSFNSIMARRWIFSIFNFLMLLGFFYLAKRQFGALICFVIISYILLKFLERRTASRALLGGLMC